jgi:hypothetical protein
VKSGEGPTLASDQDDFGFLALTINRSRLKDCALKQEAISGCVQSTLESLQEMSQLLAHRQLRLAVYTLVTTPGSIQDRLKVAWSRHLDSLDLRDAPEYLKNGFLEIRNRILPAVSDGRSNLLSDAQAVDLAQHTLFTCDDLTQMITVDHYKYVFRLLYAYKGGAKDCGGGNSKETPWFPRNKPEPIYESALNAQQKLQLAVFMLATGTDSLQHRFVRAWNEQIRQIESSEFPDYLRQSFDELKNEISSILPVREASDWTTVSEQTVQQIASKVFILSEMTTDLFLVDYYKYSITI